MTDAPATLTALIAEHTNLTPVRAERLAARIVEEWLPDVTADADEQAAAVLRRVHAASQPMAILKWEARYGLTVASVSRYILAALSPAHPASARARAAVDEEVAEHD